MTKEEYVLGVRLLDLKLNLNFKILEIMVILKLQICNALIVLLIGFKGSLLL